MEFRSFLRRARKGRRRVSGLCNSRVIVIWRRRGVEFFARGSRPLGWSPTLSFEDAFHVPLLMPRENRETDLDDRNDVSCFENFRLVSLAAN